MRKSICRITVMGSRPVEAWATGSGNTMSSGPINLLATRRPGSGIVRLKVMVGERRRGKRCKWCERAGSKPGEQGPDWRGTASRSFKRGLAKRPPSAVKTRTQNKRRGRATKHFESLLSLSKNGLRRGATDRKQEVEQPRRMLA